jgi:hypothetical protein
MNYLVEIRKYTDEGDYMEDTYEFQTKSEAINFAKENDADEILEYKEGKNYDPKHISI